MASLDGRAVYNAGAPVLGNVTTDAAHTSLAASVAFSIGAAGDTVVFGASNPFHIVCGTSGVVALTTHDWYPAGRYAFQLPTGCTHVAMIQASAGAPASGSARKG